MSEKKEAKGSLLPHVHIPKQSWKSWFATSLRGLPSDVIGSLFYAIGIYSFAQAANFAPGGISGLAIIIHHYLPAIKIGTLTLLLNIPIVLAAFHFLGFKFLLRTYVTLTINAVFLDHVMPLFDQYRGNPLLAAIFSGAFAGLGLAIIYRANTCTGGTDLIIMSTRKVRPHLSIGEITIFIDGSIIFLGWYVFGNIDAVLYGFLFTAVETVVIDKMMYGFSAGKLTLIISSKADEIADELSTRIKRGATLLSGRGAYTKKEKNVILCAMSKSQQSRAQEIVNQKDPEAFMILLDYNETFGSGFKPLGG